MIVVRLDGGLGNQMFQFAAAYALSLRLGVECKADLSAFERNIRRYELDCFAGAPDVANDRELPYRTRLQRRGMPAFLAAKVDTVLGKMAIFQERSAFVFDHRFFDLRDNSYIIGYFQTERYFSSIAAEIHKVFRFRRSSDEVNKALLDQIISTRAVSVHVRRGDYVSDPRTNQFHGTCPVEYYHTAFKWIADRVQDVRFYIFSDDPSWAEENIKPPAHSYYLSHNTGGAAYEDMRLMSNCKHHIIANSSFSWWAAWLNPSPDKIVIAPKRWLADPTVPVDDLLPANWISI